MADIARIASRAIEIALERIGTYEQHLEEAEAAALKEVPQRTKRAAFEAVLYAPVDQYVPLREAFDAQFGPDEWHNQETWGLRRQEKQG